MIDFLLSVPGKLNTVATNVSTILSRWTQAKADFVDATISSRAPAGTALDKTTWTDVRSARLDSIPAILSNVQALLLNPVLKVPSSFPLALVKKPGLNNVYLDTSGVSTPFTNYGATPNTWVSALSVTGQGVIKCLAFGAQADGSGGLKDVRVTLDNVVHTFTGVFNGTGEASGGNAAAIIGGCNATCGVIFDSVPFFINFIVEIRSSTANGAAYIHQNYHRTG